MTNEILIHHSTLDKIELPKTLYKYRQAENKLHRGILKTGKVYYSPPNGFEDKLDCKIPVRYDLLTDKEIFQKYYSELQLLNPWMGHFLLVEEANKWVAQGNFRNPQMIAENEGAYWDSLNKRFGVFSLTENNSNYAMWAKYADEFNGFCIGFDGRIMLEEIAGGGGKVEYVDELPIIKPFMDFLLQNHFQAFNKEKKWAFEEEYRSHKTWPIDVDNSIRNMDVPKEAFKELIIGEKVSEETRKELIKDAQNLNPSISIKTASISNGIIVIN